MSLVNLGRAALYQEDFEQAKLRCLQSLVLSHELGYQENIAECLETLAGTMIATMQANSAAQLLAAAEALRQDIGAPMPPADLVYYERTRRAIIAEITTNSFVVESMKGKLMNARHAVTYALQL